MQDQRPPNQRQPTEPQQPTVTMTMVTLGVSAKGRVLLAPHARPFSLPRWVEMSACTCVVTPLDERMGTCTVTMPESLASANGWP